MLSESVAVSNQPPMKHGSPDNFQTPPEALDPLLPYLKRDWTIWEPSCGEGNLVNRLNDEGFDTFGTDIIAPWHQDFFDPPPLPFDAIVTNPPFSCKGEFMQHCYDLGKPFALLLPLTTFDSAKRQKLFMRYGIEVIFMPKRISFKTPSGKGSGSWFMTAWFCWGFDLPEQLVFTGHDEKVAA